MGILLAPAPPSAPLFPTPLPGRASSSPGYFQKRWPASAILLSFPLVALPLSAAVLLSADSRLLWVYTWLFGMTHFVVTLAVYLRSENLRYFASSRKNILIFFAVPAAMFILLDLYHAFRFGVAVPLAGLLVMSLVRLADFNHLNRQSFGVLQLFKARTGVRVPVDRKKAENRYFAILTILVFIAFLAGGVCPLLQPGGALTVVPLSGPIISPLIPLSLAQPIWAGLFAVALALFGSVAVSLWRFTGSPSVLSYLIVQSLAALMAAAYFPLYLAALAVHYVEYHILMAPRVFRTPLDMRSRLDRCYGRLRARPVVLYAIIVAFAGVATLCARAGMGMMGHDPASAGEPFSYLALIAVFDGLFVFHYFVEMFIWRFGDPHFQRELAGLYFAKPAALGISQASKP